MTGDDAELSRAAARSYIGKDADLELLGSGVSGWVFSEGFSSAIKVSRYEDGFCRELAVYQRLAEHRVKTVLGLAVPRLVEFDERLRVIEMTIVKPTFILDFAQAYLDIPKDYSEEVIEEMWARVGEVFEHRAGRVREVAAELEERYGIYYYDFTPRNLNFGDDNFGDDDFGDDVER